MSGRAVLLTWLVTGASAGFAPAASATFLDYPRFQALPLARATSLRLDDLMDHADVRAWFDQIHRSFPEVERLLKCDRLLGARADRRAAAAGRLFTVLSFADPERPAPRAAFLHAFKLYSVITLDTDPARIAAGEAVFDAWIGALERRGRPVDLSAFFARPENLRGLRRFAAVLGDTVWAAGDFPRGTSLD